MWEYNIPFPLPPPHTPIVVVVHAEEGENTAKQGLLDKNITY